MLTLDIGHGIAMRFVQIPAGTFLMGSDLEPEEQPVHEVTITSPFWLGRYAVTQQQWDAVMGDNPSTFKGRMHPVEGVSWYDVQKFLKRLRERCTDHLLRLPTEAEWEYACRAGSTTAYYFGDDESQLAEYAWYFQDDHGKTHPVGERKPNAWGLYDMHGNVWEWCSDWDGDYSASPETDPTGPAQGAERIFRGGGWETNAKWCRSASRNGYAPEERSDDVGFRVCAITKPEAADALKTPVA